MNRITYFKLAGKEYPAAYTLGAEEEFEERFHGLENLKKAMEERGTTKMTLDVAEILMKHGARKAEIITGKEQEPVNMTELKEILSPTDFPDLIDQVMTCIRLGQENEVEGVPTSKKKAEEP